MPAKTPMHWMFPDGNGTWDNLLLSSGDIFRILFPVHFKWVQQTAIHLCQRHTVLSPFPVLSTVRRGSRTFLRGSDTKKLNTHKSNPFQINFCWQVLFCIEKWGNILESGSANRNSVQTLNLIKTFPFICYCAIQLHFLLSCLQQMFHIICCFKQECQLAQVSGEYWNRLALPCKKVKVWTENGQNVWFISDFCKTALMSASLRNTYYCQLNLTLFFHFSFQYRWVPLNPNMDIFQIPA